MKKNATADISVIIPCYCVADTLERAVKSAVNQSLKPREIILVDDFSNDQGLTVRKIKEVHDHYNEIISIKTIFLPTNQGAGNARNHAWEIAAGKYIAFLDADDAWHPRKLEIQMQTIEKDPSIGVCTCLFKQIQAKDIDQWNASMIVRENIRHRTIDKHTMLFKAYIAVPSAIVRRDIPHRFKNGKRYSEDLGLWLHIVFSGKKAVMIENDLCVIFKASYGASGLSSHMWAMEKGELENFKDLYNEKLLPLAWAVLAGGVSFIKYLKRLLVAFLRR